MRRRELRKPYHRLPCRPHRHGPEWRVRKTVRLLRLPEPALESNETLPEGKPDIRAALRKKVSLTLPYPQSSAGTPTDRISVQYAVAEIVKQVEVEYNLEKSRANLGDLARRWVTPTITGETCETALAKLLDPLGLSYEVENGKVVLNRK